MNQRTLQQRMAALEKLVGGTVDCLLEAKSNLVRAEWDFADANLRRLFRSAGAIARRRSATLRLLRLARKEIGR